MIEYPLPQELFKIMPQSLVGVDLDEGGYMAQHLSHNHQKTTLGCWTSGEQNAQFKGKLIRPVAAG